MFRYRSGLSGIVLAILAVALGSCAGEHRLTEPYYLVAVNKQLPYWQNARAGLLRAAAEIGVGAELIGPDNYDPAEQLAEFERVANNPDKPPAGILVSPADPSLMTPAINAAIAKGINVITIDSDAPDSNRLSFVGTDNYSVGVQSAEVTADQLQRAGTVIVFTIMGQANLEDRLRGYKDIFNQFPAIRIIEEVDIKGDATIAFDKTKEILLKDRGRMDAFVCLEAIACPEVAEVLMREGVSDKVVIAMDTGERTLGWVQKGMVYATIAQRPYTMAYTGLRMLADLHKYKPRDPETEGSLATVPKYVDTGATLVTKDNVAGFIEDQAAATAETTEADAKPAE